MKAVTLDGLAHYVWAYEPDWSAQVTTRFRVETDQVGSLTKREERAALGQSLRVQEIEATYLLSETDAAEVRNALRVLQDTPVRMPFLPALNGEGEMLSKWFMAYDRGEREGAVGNLYWTEDREDLAGRAEIVPTLLGFLADAPEFKLLTTETAQLQIRWRESSGYAERLQLAAAAWTAGPAIGLRTIYEFPFIPDFARTQDAGPVVVEVERKNFGFGREGGAAAYPQLGARTPQFNYTLSRDEAAELLRFFSDRNGPVEPFWLPCWLGECRLAANAAAADTTITVTNAAALGDHRYVMFFYESHVVTRKVTAIAGDVLTLNAAIGIDLRASGTVLSTLALVRFASGELTLKWSSPEWAAAEIAFEELTQEYATPVGETYGQTLGNLPARCFLYELRHGLEVWRWTSFESDVNYGGNAYTAAGIEHGEINDAVAWERNNCKLQLRHWSGNPFSRIATRTVTERLELIIGRGTPTDPVTNYTALFRGWITEANFDGPWIMAMAEGFGTLFQRSMPRTIMQRTDNFALFDAGNGLDRDDWTFTARLTNVSGTQLTFDSLTWPQGALPAIVIEYFALGQVTRPAPGGGVLERVPVVSSVAIDAGVLVLRLAHELTRGAPVVPETGWELTPGYDGSLATAVDKFDNARGFGGFKAIPEVNPSLVPLPKSDSSGAKK